VGGGGVEIYSVTFVPKNHPSHRPSRNRVRVVGPPVKRVRLIHGWRTRYGLGSLGGGVSGVRGAGGVGGSPQGVGSGRYSRVMNHSTRV